MTIIAKALLLALCMGGAIKATGADQSAATNVPVKTSTNWQDIQMDTEDQAMVDSWPKGLPTNGIYCALQFFRHAGARLQPTCYVYVINTTTNFLRAFLELPQETLFQIELFDPDGKLVEKTAAGKLFTMWTPDQMEDWYHHKAHNVRGGGFFIFWPKNYNQISAFGVPGIFQLKRPGEYTLHFRMQLVKIKRDASDGIHFQQLWLPEVVAKVQIRPEDVPKLETQAVGSTNAPAK